MDNFETGGNPTPITKGIGRRFRKEANEIYRVESVEDLEPHILAEFIRKHEVEQAPRLRKLKEYYLNETDIKHTYRTQDSERADNRLSHNYARYISTLIQGYMLGNPIQYKSEDEKLLDAVENFNDDNSEHTHNTRLELDLSIYGRAFELVYRDEESNERIARIDPETAFMIYGSDVKGTPIAGVRYYDVGVLSAEKRIVELYTDTHFYRYKANESGNLQVADDEEAHFFGGIPLIEYWNNDDRTGDFEPVMDLIDAYDNAQSDTLNSMDDFADSYLVLAGQPDTKREDIQAMKESRVIVLGHTAIDGQNPNAFYLTKTYDVAGEEAFKNRVVNDLHKLSFTPDLTDEKFASNVSGEAMKYKLFILDQIRSTKERLFKEALDVRYRLLTQVWNIKNKTTAFNSLEYVFTPNLPKNTTELADLVSKLNGILSEETLIGLLPFVEDVEAEMKRMKEEREASISEYQTQLPMASDE